jgi:uncharacterized protein YyaL (SSP411 family)
MISHEFTNELIHETSPYLLQHSHNPVNWLPWSNKALELAKVENKPILVSIGYSSCHWCHVMERESFEDKHIAGLMNSFFINIKVDREERPDLDNIYMDAVQTLSGHGGWPLNVFLTPEAKPFYGGTYFPPVNKYNKPSWEEIITFINDVWINRKTDVLAQADQLTKSIGTLTSRFVNLEIGNQYKSAGEIITTDFFKEVRNKLLQQADASHGGFGQAPKFPQTFSIKFLLMYDYFFHDEASKQHALKSLIALLNGGINDHLSGGFARYSTDDQWLVPHFEKMLYDNALITDVLCDAYQITGEEIYKKGIEETITFCINNLKETNGGFMSAIDADSEGEEGKYYVWEKETIDKILGKDAEYFCSYYGVKTNGNWEEKNILHVSQSIQSFAIENGIDANAFIDIINSCKKKLLVERNKRKHPEKDDKILLSWNALFLISLSRASAALKNNHYRIIAENLFDFIISNFTEDGNLFYHSFKNGKKKQIAFLDDYAYLIKAFISLQEMSGDVKYLDWAKKLTDYVMTQFGDKNSGLFYYTHQIQEDIIIRKIEIHDGAIPSGNSIMAENLQYLARVFANSEWKMLAEKMLFSNKAQVEKHPASFAVWAMALLKEFKGYKEIIVTGKGNQAFLDAILLQYIPNSIKQSAETEIHYPLLTGKKYENQSLIYVCEQSTCSAPFDAIDDFLKFIKI